ncbi:MAG: hypothetical protein GY754_27175, partial [bacterium]|nr:hypothetical protein [bacterium]
MKTNILKQLTGFLIVSILVVSGCEEGLYKSISPIEGSFIINGGEYSTSSKTATLNINIANADEMRFSNVDGHWREEWESYSSKREWTLADGAGEKIIYAQFRRRLSRKTIIKTARIILEDGTVSRLAINSGSYYTLSTSVTLKVNTTGITETRFRNYGQAWEEWQEYSPGGAAWTLPAGTGEKVVYGELKDASGKIISVSDTIIMADAETLVFILNDGVSGTFSNSITINSHIPNAQKMRLSNDGINWTAWEDYLFAKKYM